MSDGRPLSDADGHRNYRFNDDTKTPLTINAPIPIRKRISKNRLPSHSGRARYKRLYGNRVRTVDAFIHRRVRLRKNDITRTYKRTENDYTEIVIGGVKNTSTTEYLILISPSRTGRFRLQIVSFGFKKK